MTQLRALPPSLAASAALLLFALAPRLAQAESTCADSSDCDKGFECAVVAGSGCASASPCTPGSACPEPAPCEVTEEKACVLAHCSSDAQCATGMVCHAWAAPCAVTSCACPPNEPSCNCGAPPECAATESICTPRYVLPCENATDCGEGFSCEEQQLVNCAATGSAGTPAMGPTPSDGGAGPAQPLPGPDPIPEQPTCTPQPSGQFACVPKTIECGANSDCPTGWLCQAEAPSAAPGCDGCPEGSPPPTPPAARLCRPEYAGAIDSSGRGDGGILTSGSGTAENGVDPGGAQPQAPSHATDGDAGANESSACQMGHAPASQGALSFLALLGALLGLKRRRG